MPELPPGRPSWLRNPYRWPSWTAIWLALWCLGETVQQLQAARLYYELATAAGSRSPLAVAQLNVPLALGYLGIAAGLWLERHWARAAVRCVLACRVLFHLAPIDFGLSPWAAHAESGLDGKLLPMLASFVVSWFLRYRGEGRMSWRRRVETAWLAAWGRLLPPREVEPGNPSARVDPVLRALAWRGDRRAISETIAERTIFEGGWVAIGAWPNTGSIRLRDGEQETGPARELDVAHLGSPVRVQAQLLRVRPPYAWSVVRIKLASHEPVGHAILQPLGTLHTRSAWLRIEPANGSASAPVIRVPAPFGPGDVHILQYLDGTTPMTPCGWVLELVRSGNGPDR